MTVKKAVIVAVCACLIAMGAYIALELTGVTFRVTGLEISQVNKTIEANWDDTEGGGYRVSVFEGDKRVETKCVNISQYTFDKVKPGKSYTVVVKAKDDVDDGKLSKDDSATIETKKTQKLSVKTDVEDTFTADSFTVTAKADGNITYETDNGHIATVNKKGKVDIVGEGKARITVQAEETDSQCATRKTITVNAGESYEGDMPELPNAIASEAWKCAWPYKTSKSVYKYGGGSPTSYFKSAISEAYPEHLGWGNKQCRWGASCDVFVGTVVRKSGYDKNFPRGLDPDYSYLPRSSKFKKVSLSDIQSGDIVMYSFKGGGGHICIYVEDDNGTGYIANAHYMLKTYGIIERKNPHFRASKYRTFGVYRATEDCTANLSEGEKSDEVKKTQKFLKWAGFYDGKADGYYGKDTAKSVKKFQKAAGTNDSGEFGKTSIKKAKKYKRNSIEIAQE